MEMVVMVVMKMMMVIEAVAESGFVESGDRVN